MLRSKIGLIVVVAGVIALAACTRFFFPQAIGGAPGRLADRSAMAKIEGGTFEMGDNQGEPHEYPVHTVDLSPFLIDVTEVTNEDYRSCVDANICRHVKEMDDPLFGAPRQPVVGVTWSDANKYCKWVAKRLPTEAEWERAARGTEKRMYPFMGGYTEKKANLRGSADGFSYTAPVKSFPEGKNPDGLYDMAGNAGEWVADWFAATYYAESDEKDPTGPGAPTRERCVRGGSWTGNNYEARAAARSAMDPSYSKNNVGFRCAASP